MSHLDFLLAAMHTNRAIYKAQDFDREELAAEDRFDRKAHQALLRNPDCRDPDHPGCDSCEGNDE